MGHDPLAFTFDRTPRSNRRYSCVLHHVFQTCSLPTTVNHGKSVPRFFTLFVTLSPPSLIVSLFLNFERKLRRPLEGRGEFSRLNFSRFNFSKRRRSEFRRRDVTKLTKFSFLVVARGKQSREPSRVHWRSIVRGSASGKLKVVTEFS